MMKKSIHRDSGGHRLRQWILAIGIIALVVFALFRIVFAGLPSASDFAHHRDRYFAVVDHIAKMEFSDSILLTCDADWNVETIEPVQAEGREGYKIAATRLADGRLVVALVTADWGHAGIYGYVYCSGELRSAAEIGPDTWGGEEISIKVSADVEWWVEDSLTDHWWVVSNQLQ